MAKRKAIKMDRPIFVGIAGGTASGKTSVCEYLLKTNEYFFLP
jgi:uridine kinase